MHARRNPEARFVLFTANDGYTTNMAIEDFASEEALIAHSWENEPLTRTTAARSGSSCRTFISGKAEVAAQDRILPEDHRGFWEVRGYHNHADPWKEQRYSGD